MRWQADWREYVDKIIQSYPDLEQKVAGGGELTEKEKRRFDALRATLAEMEGIYTEQLHTALEDCISTLDERQAVVIRARYFEDMELSDIGGMLGVNTSRVGELERSAMRKIRSGRNIRRLRQYRDMIISKHAYHGTGLSAWKCGGSVEERTVICLEDRELL